MFFFFLKNKFFLLIKFFKLIFIFFWYICIKINLFEKLKIYTLNITIKNINDNDLLVDVVKSYNTVKNRGRYPVTFHKPFDYANTEQYKSNKEQFPDYTPGPEYYWKNIGLDTNERPKQVEEEKEINGKTRKIYYMNHQRTDFREYKPMRKSVY